jgi:hypothetical protein
MTKNRGVALLSVFALLSMMGCSRSGLAGPSAAQIAKSKDAFMASVEPRFKRLMEFAELPRTDPEKLRYGSVEQFVAAMNVEIEADLDRDPILTVAANCVVDYLRRTSSDRPESVADLNWLGIEIMQSMLMALDDLENPGAKTKVNCSWK